jgi:hypothetical protein
VLIVLVAQMFLSVTMRYVDADMESEMKMVGSREVTGKQNKVVEIITVPCRYQP